MSEVLTNMDSYRGFLEADLAEVLDEAMLADLKRNNTLTLEPADVINAYSFVSDVELWHARVLDSKSSGNLSPDLTFSYNYIHLSKVLNLCQEMIRSGNPVFINELADLEVEFIEEEGNRPYMDDEQGTWFDYAGDKMKELLRLGFISVKEEQPDTFPKSWLNS